MDLAHDCLDARIVDRDGVAVGRVDSVIAEWSDDGALVIVAVEVGPVALASRLHPRIGALVARWLRRGGGATAKAWRIPWSDLTRDGDTFRIDAAAAKTPAWAGERWLRDRIVRRMPGA